MGQRADRQTGRWAGRRTGWQTGRQTDRRTQTGSYAGRQIKLGTDRGSIRLQSYRQTDWQTDRQPLTSCRNLSVEGYTRTLEYIDADIYVKSGCVANVSHFKGIGNFARISAAAAVLGAWGSTQWRMHQLACKWKSSSSDLSKHFELRRAMPTMRCTQWSLDPW